MTGTTLHVEAFGVACAVRIGAGVPIAAVQEILPPGTRHVAPAAGFPEFRIEGPGHPGATWRVSGDDGEARCVTSADAALDLLDGLVRALVSQAAPAHVFVHAGVVRWQGCTVVVPGASGTGKSTLVAALVAAGAEYWSDEYAVFDDGGLLHPFPRPIALVEPGRAVKRRVVVSASGGLADAPRALDVVAVAPYREGAAWRPEALAPADCALALLAHAVAGRLDPARVLRVLGRAARGAAGWRGTRGDIGGADRSREWLETLTGRQR